MKRPFNAIISLTLGAAAVYAAACMSGGGMGSTSSGGGAMDMSTSPPSPDPRVGLAPGTMNVYSGDTTKRVIGKKAAEAYWNMRILSNMPPKEPFIGVTHSDLAFRGNLVIQGNYDGYQIWPWFSDFMGGIRFSNYIPAFASGQVKVEDKEHPCMKNLPLQF